MAITTVLTYTEDTDNNLNFGQIHIKFSEDYGATWTAEDTFIDAEAVTGFPMSPEGEFDQNMQSLVIKAPNGNLILMMWNQDYNPAAIGGGTFKSISTDSGKTWSAPTLVVISGISEADNLVTFATDQAVVVGTEIYISCIHYSYAAEYYDVVIKSTDNGVNWAYVGKITGTVAAAEAGLEYIGNSTFISVIRPGAGLPKTAWSYDMGETWTEPELTRGDFSGFSSGGRLHLWTRAHLKGEASWWTDNVLIMCGFGWNGTARINCLWVSGDQGVSWNHRGILDDGAGLGGYGDVIWNPTTSEYVAVMHKGANEDASIKQYNVTITGI